MGLRIEQPAKQPDEQPVEATLDKPEPRTWDSDSFSVAFIGWGGGGQGWYRSMLPASVLGAGLLMRDKDGGLVAQHGDVDADVYVFQMPDTEQALEEITLRREAGSIVVADVDDDMQALVDWGMHPTAYLFTDERIDMHHRCLRACHAITTPTQHLAKTMLKRGMPRPWVVPNFIDMDRFKARPRQRSGLIVGLSGAPYHQFAVSDVVREIDLAVARLPRASTIVVGIPWVADALGSKVVNYGWQPRHNHAALLQEFDIMLGPALPNEFYAGKSDLRFAEAAAAGAVFIGDEFVYGGTVEDGVTGFLYDGPGELYDVMVRVMDDRKVRRDVRRRALKWVRKTRDASTAGRERWSEVLEEIVEVSR